MLLRTMVGEILLPEPNDFTDLENGRNSRRCYNPIVKYKMTETTAEISGRKRRKCSILFQKLLLERVTLKTGFKLCTVSKSFRDLITDRFPRTFNLLAQLGDPEGDKGEPEEFARFYARQRWSAVESLVLGWEDAPAYQLPLIAFSETEFAEPNPDRLWLKTVAPKQSTSVDTQDRLALFVRPWSSFETVQKEIADAMYGMIHTMCDMGPVVQMRCGKRGARGPMRPVYHYRAFKMEESGTIRDVAFSPLLHPINRSSIVTSCPFLKYSAFEPTGQTPRFFLLLNDQKTTETNGNTARRLFERSVIDIDISFAVLLPARDHPYNYYYDWPVQPYEDWEVTLQDLKYKRFVEDFEALVATRNVEPLAETRTALVSFRQGTWGFGRVPLPGNRQRTWEQDHCSQHLD